MIYNKCMCICEYILYDIYFVCAKISSIFPNPGLLPLILYVFINRSEG